MEYFGVTAGSIHATQTATEHNNAGNSTTSNSCPGTGGSEQICGATITCVGGVCSSSENPEPCGPSQFPETEPVTGRCVSD